MSVGILLITHNNIGTVIQDTAKKILGSCPFEVKALDVPFDCDPDKILDTAKKLVEQIDSGDGVLVLTDMYGATPSNIAHRLTHQEQLDKTKVVAGLNLPMLFRLLNYPALSLTQLSDKAVSGGREGVLMNRRGH